MVVIRRFTAISHPEYIIFLDPNDLFVYISAKCQILDENVSTDEKVAHGDRMLTNEINLLGIFTKRLFI